MGKKGLSTVLKRNMAPNFWPIKRKEAKWIVKPSPGPHALKTCLPLAILLRENLGIAKTRKEVKKIVTQDKVYVDCKIRRKYRFPVGLMDVISIPEINKFYRVIPSSTGLIIHPIIRKESNFKLCRIEGKSILKKGYVQLNLHDGSNLIVQQDDKETENKITYKTLDTLKITLPEKKIIKHLRIKEKNIAIIIGGKNIGKYGEIVEIERVEGKKNRKFLVTIKSEKGDLFKTILNLVFTLGKKKSLISMPGEN